MEESVSDLTEEKEEPNEKKEKKKVSHSEEIYKAFYPIHIFLLVFGRLPFTIEKKSNGSCVFKFKRLSPHTIYFLLTCVTSTIVFFMMILGYTTLYFSINDSNIKNRCQLTWESFNLRRTAVPTALTVSWLYLTFTGTMLILFRGKEYIHYMNFWNRAVQVMDMDPTDGVRKVGITDHAHFLVLIIMFLILFASKLVPSLQAGAGGVSNALVRLFMQDIGLSKKFSDEMSKADNGNCDKRPPGKYFIKEDYEDPSYTAWKVLGFFIQIYAIYGSRCFIIQFKFYTHMLRNISKVWNERFRNALHGVVEDPEDQTKRRLQMKLLMKDHLIVVQMFKLTESAFATTLRAFYAVQVANLCCELYFLSQMQGQSGCEKVFGELTQKQEIMKACLNMEPNANMSNLFDPKAYMWFDDPCLPVETAVLHEALVALVLLAQTLRSAFSVTWEASLAYEEAMNGFKILRRHSFMHCKSRRERNFMHSLIFSFARNNPINITAGKYFVINRTLVAVITGAIFTYYIILLQFSPGQFDTGEHCISSVCGNADKEAIYPDLKKACEAEQKS